ncbi:MAG TPA: 16S rRNA (cytidine(1402)-2'-O)-methyltransferase [Patescibacteria group bacterium]|nr:16S rRNA (cytidine(1402)-2'-O)-methyltransferase [Patescibacteria group bacterium]
MESVQFYLVSTPIGNLGDCSARAIEALGAVDTVFAEDTRKARTLFRRYGINTPLRPFHDHNKVRVTPTIIALLKEGGRAALISNAGTPLVSDPGYYLVRRLVEEEIPFTAVPGPCAVIQALVVSGLPPDRFTFFGFLPRKQGERERTLREAGQNPGTSIFFESPFRIVRTLETIADILGDREIVVARELTKLHEEVKRGTASELAVHFGASRVKGEITVLIRGTGRKAATGS